MARAYRTPGRKPKRELPQRLRDVADGYETTPAELLEPLVRRISLDAKVSSTMIANTAGGRGSRPIAAAICCALGASAADLWPDAPAARLEEIDAMRRDRLPA